MIMLYIMILYSKFNTNPITYFMFGYGYIGALGLLLIVNISLMFYNIIQKVRKNMMLKNIKK